ncbi:MAG: FKBP-type peptidyl-prolyl cis-trans isomerase [Muribaculaceae bacterium]|nr:FKBP-type peptidyl-prolyl cis-trans isomerase [Muribaculaceae bacterium]
MANNEIIKPGKYTELVYRLYQIEPDGKETLVYESDEAEPEKLVFGVTRGVLPVLERALDGLAAGEKFDVTAGPDEAFGHHDPEQVVELGREVFEIDGKFDEENIKAGNRLPMMTADGFRIDGLVTEVTPTTVKMDFNHPLVDKTVRFDGEIKTVRDATPEEVAPAHSCGCGDGCGCGDDCGCDDKADKSCGCNGCH